MKIINLKEFYEYTKFRIDFTKNPENSPCGRYGGMASEQGKVIDRAEMMVNSGNTAYIYNGIYYAPDTIYPEKTSKRVIKKDKEACNDFKVNDVVKIRTIPELKKYYASNEDLGVIYTEPVLTKTRNIWPVRGKQGVIIDIFENNRCNVFFETDEEDITLKLSFEALEHVPEAEINNLSKEREENLNKVKALKQPVTEALIDEMISKVDMAKVKKIMAGAYGVKATELKGIDTIIRDWAHAKKDIYLMFGRELKLKKAITYTMSDYEIDGNVKALADKFPRFCSVKTIT